jgi:hypothetical protein
MASADTKKHSDDLKKVLEMTILWNDLNEDLHEVEWGPYRDKMLAVCQSITFIDYVLIAINEDLNQNDDLAAFKELMDEYFRYAWLVIKRMRIIFQASTDLNLPRNKELKKSAEKKDDWARREAHWNKKVEQVYPLLQQIEGKLGKKWSEEDKAFRSPKRT